MEPTHELTRKEDISIDGKYILDACCGSRMMWEKEYRNNEHVLYQDIRQLYETLCDGRKLVVNPDVFASYTNMPYDDNSFYMVVWDPPHLLNLGESSWMFKKYGKLDKNNWKDEMKIGFSECMRVLKDKGTLCVKFSTRDIPISEFYDAIGRKPLFGSTTGRNGLNIWMVFMKGL